ncbi:MAG: conjugal transfer protein TraD [Pseudomonadota bacterium]|nr:conjugal transfer protein TraD [Pseudomonadota bacterium]
MPFEALVGALLAAVEQARKQPEAVARWTERGQAFFRQGPSGARRPHPATLLQELQATAAQLKRLTGSLRPTRSRRPQGCRSCRRRTRHSSCRAHPNIRALFSRTRCEPGRGRRSG